ncbi:MAG: ABC transporter permease subunit [Chloroflexi bacterium]|nr:ABC transporter permease subunit [Chloroflexota bacterium]MBP8057656.1 ABC transporter permease subunit [Chloroflexota bacterium]
MTTKSITLPYSPPTPTWRTRLAQLAPWLGVVPFFLFALAFLLAPASFLFIGSFRDLAGNFTLDNYRNLGQELVVEAYTRSIQISAVTALGGGFFGFLLAYAVTVGGLPRFVRSALLTFSGVASNFAGVPLAFAFIATLGRIGLVTTLLKTAGIDIYDSGFTLYSFLGLSLTYMYFQFPLMVLIITPALEGLKGEWREAAENLGATSWQYWRYVALPILLPSILGTMILLFANAFGAHATAFALTGGTYNLVTILIGAQMRGDVLRDPGLGYALAVGMVIIMTVSIAGYTLLQRRAERWLKR